MKKFLILAMLLSTVSACGGGSSGTSVAPSAASFTSFGSTPADGSYVLKGTAVTASYSANLSTGAVTTSAPSVTNNATVTVTNSGGSTVAETINTPASTASFDTRNGDKAYAAGAGTLISTADGHTLIAQANVAATGYNYQSYGAWLTGYNTGSGTVGVATVGAQTPSSDVPKAGTANYSGYSTGFAKSSGGAYFTTSNVSVTTDFNNVNVASTGTSLVNTNTGATSPASQLDFSGSGKVSGNTFATNVSGSTVSGTANGTFYGPTAQEVGGTFQTSGGGYTYVGAFGGK